MKNKEFTDFYTINTRYKNTQLGLDGQFETYGKDLERIKKIFKRHPSKVWTMVAGEDGDTWVVSGLHFVNRLSYLVTKEDAKTTEEYRY